MASRRIRAGTGLSTDATELEQPEALRRAENVMLHRPGIIQPRIGFGDTTGFASRSTDYRPLAIIPWEADSVVFSVFDAAYRLDRASVNSQYTGAFVPFNVNLRARPGWIQARGSLYLTTSTGIKKLAAIGDSAVTRAGVWMTYQAPGVSRIDATADSDRDAIESGSSAAYRWVVRKTDANGYVARSAPSSRIIVRAPAGSYANGIYVNLGDIYLPDEAVAGDVLELYRTRNSGDDTADPGEDFYLAATYIVTSTDISNTKTPGTTWTDDAKDGVLGAALYTSASQFGALAAKETPPLTHDLAWWNGCAWAAATTERKTLSVWLQKVACDAATNRLEGEGLCYNSNGSYAGVSTNTLTGVTFGAGGFGWDTIAVGMWVSDAAPTTTIGRIPLNARIVSFNSGAGTITLNVAPLNSGTFNCGDIVTVNSVEFYAYSVESLTLKWFDVEIADTDPDVRAYETALSLCRVISAEAADTNSPTAYGFKDETATGGTGEFILVNQRPEDTTLNIGCTMRGSAFAPNITSAYSAPTGAKLGRVAWSALDEPEAWPLTQSTVVGDQSKHVLRLIPVEGALLVWKEDGLYSITGSPPFALSVDEVELGIRLITPDAACVLNGICFALTDRGLVAATAGGVQLISPPIAFDLREGQRLWPLDYGRLDNVWLCPHRRFGLIMVATETEGEDPGVQYIFNAMTRQWNTWTRELRCAAYDSYNDKMVVAPNLAAWIVNGEWLGEAVPGSYLDASLTALTANVSGTTVTIATSQFGAYTPAVGDILQTSSVFRRITAVVAGGGNYTITVDSTGLSGVSANWFQGYECVVEWMSQNLPGIGSRWTEMQFRLQHSTNGALTSFTADVGGSSERDTTPTTVTPTLDTHNYEVTQSQVLRVGMPRALVRASDFYPYWSVNTAASLWRLTALDLHFLAQSQRTAR